jgi:DNA polymerase-4
MFLFLDMNSYFASVEQQLRPELRGVPVGVIPNDCDTTCCIAASYEAKAHGVKTGTGVREARLRCPSIQLVLSRPDLYIEHHHKIVEAVETVHPVTEVHSIDEMSMRLRGRDREPLAARQLGMEMKAAIRSRVGEWLRCSVGIAPNVMLAKTAGEMVKPDGLVVIERKELPQRLYTLDVTDLPGINRGIQRRLRSYGIETMQQLCAASKPQLRTAWGSILGETWWDWLHGNDPWIRPTKRRNIGHQHVLAPDLRAYESARAVAIRLLMKAATRMRSEGYWCTKLVLNVRPVDAAPWTVYQNLEPCQCTVRLLRHLDALWYQQRADLVLCISVTLSGLIRDGNVELPLFEGDRKLHVLSHTIDEINRKYGHARVYFASMHDARKSAPLRIPFSTVPDLKLPDFVREKGRG